MLNPAIGELIDAYENRYRLVLEVAKKAREIAGEAEQKGEIIVEKPVSLAITQLAGQARQAAEQQAAAAAEAPAAEEAAQDE